MAVAVAGRGRGRAASPGAHSLAPSRARTREVRLLRGWMRDLIQLEQD